MATQLALEMKAERARLSNQCELILGRLWQGRASNSELSEIALRYSARIMELRRRGHDIRIVKRERSTGLTVYALFIDGREWGR